MATVVSPALAADPTGDWKVADGVATIRQTNEAEVPPKDVSLRVTIKDVSREAGVSIKTVSRVLNNEKYVGAETRARVTAVACTTAPTAVGPSQIPLAVRVPHTRAMHVRVGRRAWR